MIKVFKSASQSVDEATVEIEHSLLKGHVSDGIPGVTYKGNKDRIESLTISAVDSLKKKRINPFGTNQDTDSHE